MNIWDIIIIVIIAIAVIFAIRSTLRRKGRCSCGCEGCGGKCSERKNV